MKALRALGHQTLMVPLYLPLVTDDEPANPEIDVKAGGINLYLQQRLPLLAGLLPHPLRSFLDRRSQLLTASKWAGMTSPRDLGRMTLGSLQGQHGNQRHAWRQLVDWIARDQDSRPDIVSLSNSLLSGLIPLIHERIGCPVMVSLQGEDAFLDSLPNTHREKCWTTLVQLAAQADALIAPSQYYASTMTRRLRVKDKTMHVVANGLEWENYLPGQSGQQRNTATIGYLGRMIAGKGLGNIIEAFLSLHRSADIPDLTLHLAGAATLSDRRYLRGLRRRIAKAGASERVQWLPNIEFKEKVDFFHAITVFSMPAPSSYGEAFGLPVLEAIACGAPVVQPRHGAYPEIIAQTGGGLLVEPDDPQALAMRLRQLILDPELRSRIANHGSGVARRLFSAKNSAQAFEKVAQECLCLS
jgi:glycosyltransferase involved in cell wall biosynthesis